VVKHLVAKYYEILNPKFFEKPIQIVDENGRKQIHKKYLETTYHKTHYADKEPQVLTYDDLEFGFVIWFGSLVLPSIAFLVEMICILIEKNRKHKQDQHENSNQIELFEISETHIEEIPPTSSEINKINNATKLESLDIIKTLEQLEAIDDVFGPKVDHSNEGKINIFGHVELVRNRNHRRLKQARTDQIRFQID
jgi:hypothetical protein